MKRIYKLTPALFANLWGGNKLRAFGKDSAEDRIGESWELSFVPGSEALADGKRMSEAFPKSTWGKRAERFEFFPTLTKFIDAREKLSVQVHPSDEYALKNEGQYGKSEMWYVVAADEGAGLYMGFEREYTKDEITRAIADGVVETMLSFKPVLAGDVFFIPAGTVHAIGGGVLIFEIQQNSTLTYRLYDYGRRDKAGNLRELHVDRAMNVLNTGVYHQAETAPGAACGERTIGECEYFTVKEYTIDGSTASVTVDGESFKSITVVSGECEITSGTEVYTAQKGDSFFIPAQDSELRVCISGTAKFITVCI